MRNTKKATRVNRTFKSVDTYKVKSIRVRFCFFFSSRRRHTRFDCDWSSDVCSSDLSFENARLTAYCDGSVKPVPCEVTFEFENLAGRTLKQATLTIQPNTSGFLDLDRKSVV